MQQTDRKTDTRTDTRTDRFVVAVSYGTSELFLDILVVDTIRNRQTDRRTFVYIYIYIYIYQDITKYMAW